MRSHVALLVGLLAMGVLAGCSDVLGERGSGNLDTEVRDVSEFDEVELTGSGVVTIDVDGTESLVIEAEDNLLPLLTSDVESGRLVLGTRSSIAPTEEIRYTISAAALNGVAITGSGKITAVAVDTSSFEVTISGSGTVVLEGTSGELDVSISGSGDYEGTGLTAQTGTVQIAGSGDAVVNVTEELEITISGSGNVTYLGSPAVAESVTGSGNISQR